MFLDRLTLDEKKMYLALAKKAAEANNIIEETEKEFLNDYRVEMRLDESDDVSDYTMYYMLDEDTHKFVTFSDYETSALEGTFSGSLNKGFTLTYSKDWNERIEFVGSSVTITSNDGDSVKFTRMTGTEADKVYNQKIKSTYNAD